MAFAAGKSGLEAGTNRSGGDFRDFETSASAVDCQAACKADESCRSFTWVKPGVQGPEAPCRSFTWVKPGAQGVKSHCWLKNDVPPPTPDGNCVSGLAVHAPGSGGCGCVATTCAAACKDAIVMLCVAGGTTKDDAAACQKCIDSNCP